MKNYFGWLRRSSLFKRAKLFVKRLQGRELWLRPELDVSLYSIDSWGFCPDGLGSSSTIYSLGVGDDLIFDLAFMDRFGSDIHAFDPTPISIELVQQWSLPESFHFYPQAVSREDSTIRFYPRIMDDGSLSKVQYTTIAAEGSPEHAVEVPALTLESIMRELGHESIDLMKMNIEGAEYDVLDNMLDSGIFPKQIVVEFHHRFPNIGLAKTESILARLRKSGYRLIFVSKSGRIMTLLRAGDMGSQ